MVLYIFQEAMKREGMEKVFVGGFVLPPPPPIFSFSEFFNLTEKKKNQRLQSFSKQIAY